MKKYIIFAVSFIGLFFVFELLTGMVLTSMYVPDIENAWNASAALASETVIQGDSLPFSLTLLGGFLAATIAYFISKKVSTGNTGG